MSAATSRLRAPVRCSEDYVQCHFDKFAATFEDVLIKQLAYRGPEIIESILKRYAGAPSRKFEILDAGCGTGLCGQAIAAWSRSIVGVDLSTEMIARARERRIYTELVVDELCAFMNSRPRSLDWIVSADVLIYFGALEELVHSAATALRPSGFLVVTVEALLDDPNLPYRLEVHGRYSHSANYIRRVLSAAGFRVLEINQETIRWELGEKVAGYGVVACLGD